MRSMLDSSVKVLDSYGASTGAFSMANGGHEDKANYVLTEADEARKAYLLECRKIVSKGERISTGIYITVPEIDRALVKIYQGTGNICDDCEEEIAAERIALVPSAYRCCCCQAKH